MIPTSQPFLSLRALIAVLSGTMIFAGASAGKPPEGQGQQSPPALDAETIFDPIVAETIAAEHIPGVVLTVIENGKVVLSRGYGHAELASKRPVSPEATLFRIASVSKVFTATAVLRLAEKGALDLEGDVNHYLQEFQLETNGFGPVRVGDLLTHTSGLDELYIGTASRTREGQLPLATYLALHVPRRVLPAGEVIAYTNQGLTLAGYMVEVATGMPFDSYLREGLFEPLGMRRSGFRLTVEEQAHLAVGYAYTDGGFQVAPYDYLNYLPAAGLSTTAADMARFMISLLGGGDDDGEPVLSDRVREGLLRRQFSAHPLLAGRTYCCFEQFKRHQRMIAHEGDIRGFASGMYLFPDHRLGMFVAYNRETPVLREKLLEAWVKELFPEPEEADSEAGRAETDPTRLVGLYRMIRYPRSTFDKLAVLVGYAPQMEVVLDDRGALDLVTPGGGRLDLVEVEPGFFQRRGQVDRLSGKGFAFHLDGDGESDFLSFGGVLAAHRLAWYENTQLLLVQAVGSILFFFLTCLILPVRSLWRRKRKREEESRETKWMVRVAWGLSLLNLVFLVGLTVSLMGIDSYEFTYGVPGPVELLLVLPPVTVLLALVLPVLVARSWRGATSRFICFYSSIVSLIGLFLIPFLLYWNLLDFWFS